MANVKQSEERLLNAARGYCDNPNQDKPRLLEAALEYGKAKVRSWKSRDRWKMRKRLEVKA